MRRRVAALLLLVMAALLMAVGADAQRRVTPAPPVVPGQPQSPEVKPRRPVNPEHLAHTHDENGNVILVDTITGTEWVDSAAMKAIPKMQYPLIHSLSVGVDIWDAAMRAFGQKYGLGGVTAQLSMHNRYIAVLDFGLGQARDTPSGSNFTYRSPVSPYFRIGADYNIFYNSSPDYQLRAGLRYGLSPFSWCVDNVTTDDGYWDEPASFSIPSRRTLAGWLEVRLSVKVKIAGPVSAGWAFRFNKPLHQTGTDAGKPLVIPGMGKQSQSFSGAFSIYYTFEINRRTEPDVVTDAAP